MLPIWGVSRPEEYYNTPMRKILKNVYSARTRNMEGFLGSFEKLLRSIISGGERNNLLAESITELYEHLQNHDYRTLVRTEKFWNLFTSIIESYKEFEELSLFEAIEICRTIVRELEVLTVDVPKTRLVHSSIASSVGFLAVVAKLRDKTPFILTEHGIYYRERVLDIAGRFPKRQKSFWIRFERSIAKLNYEYADLIAPVSKFNARWEGYLGADKGKIEVIYNGVDTDRFKPMAVDRLTSGPVITTVTRIDRLKGVLDLISAMATVREKVPNAKCLIFGSGSDETYLQDCLKARHSLGLSDSVEFMGFTTETPRAFNSGDVVALPSVSEGFPYALIEGMACEKASVATDVGGVGEALGDSGILVPPRDSTRLGEALSLLLTDTLHSRKLGLAARDRILSEYTVSKFAEAYRRVYQRWMDQQ